MVSPALAVAGSPDGVPPTPRPPRTRIYLEVCVRRLRFVLPLLLALLTVGAAAAALTLHSADVVVHFPNSQVAIRHVTFDNSLSGLGLLEASGLRVETTSTGAVCRIQGVGCPTSDCFCQCTGSGPCRYWAYWRWDGAQWQASLVGAGQATVTNGALDGWRWGDGPPTADGGRSPSLMPSQRAAYAAAEWLRAQQLASGGFTTDTYRVGLTLDAALAGAAANAAPQTWRAAGGQSILDFLTAEGPAYADHGTARELGKLIAGVVAVEGTPRAFAGRDLVADLDSKFDGQHYGQFNWDQAWAMLALRAAGAPIPPAAAQALLSDAVNGGGWGFAPGMSAEVDSTGLVLQALVAAGVPPTTTVIAAAKTYLQTQQNSDGGFPVRAGGASNAPSTAYAVMGLVAIGENPLAPTWQQSGGNPIDALLRAQSAAGGLAGTSGDNDLQATAQSVPALMGRLYPVLGRRVAVNRATAWLRTQQAPSGQFGFGAGSTIDALFVIAALGQDPNSWRQPGGQSPLDYLAVQADTYSAAGAAQTAKIIVGLNAVGVDPQGFGGVDLPARLAAAETSPGVYGGATAQAWATLALRVLAQPSALAATTLRGQQRPDGGWSLSPSDASDTNTTALALQALAAAGEPLDGTLVISATGYLHTRQALDGGFPRQAGDADTNSTAVVLQALTALRADGDSLGWTTHLTATDGITLTAHTPVDWLLGQQTPSGAFPFFAADSDFATLQVIPALLDRPLPVVLRRLHLPLVQRGSNLSQPR